MRMLLTTLTRGVGRRVCVWFVMLAVLALPRVAAQTATAAVDWSDGVNLRFYQGVVAYIDNPEGKAFDVTLQVREWNLVENGPREVLVKVYDPDGHSVVREVVPDDGVVGDAFMPEAGGWDHEMWYYALNYGRGTVPMLRWSSLTEPSRVARLAARTLRYDVAGGKKGVYRVQLMASRDHVVGLQIGGGLKYALGGHPMWMHGHGDMFAKTYVYVPKGTIALNLGFAEFDQPVTRRFTVTAPDGQVLWEGRARGGFQDSYIPLQPQGKYDDQVLTVEVSAGTSDFMMHVQLGRDDIRLYRGKGGVPALFAPDVETAKALRGGAIYHDGKVFWHGFQVRLHDWLKANVSDADCIVKDADGKVLEPVPGRKYGWNAQSYVYEGLPTNPDFIALNGGHEAPPLCDHIMHNYSAHHNRAALNVALRDLHEGLRMITVGDQVVIGGFIGNMGYVFGTYGWHYWRPAWRIVRDSDAPDEVKAIIREGMILCADRLAFSRGIERTNGNALSHIPMALAYAAACTQDPMVEALSHVYFERFSTGGWGKGAGISPSGDCQEHFAHDFHYGSYIFANYRAVVNDLGEKRFRDLLARTRELYTYLYCPAVAAYPWGSRTSQQASAGSEGWKGEPGADFTVDVNGGSEWFAARRAKYYLLTFHGRLAPQWLAHYFGTQLGYGGGAICQLTVPGRGPVLVSTLNGAYGAGMQPHRWRDFNVHGVVGTMADGSPLVAACSEHLDARLEGNTVTSSGEVRDRPVHVTRRYTYEPDHVHVEVELADTYLRAAYWGKGPNSTIREAYEMLPFLGPVRRSNGPPSGKMPSVQAITADGELKPIGADASVNAGGFIIDRGGYGVKVVLDTARDLTLGQHNTVLIGLTTAAVKPAEIRIAYDIIPFIGDPTTDAVVERQSLPLPQVGYAELAQVAQALDGAQVTAQLVTDGDRVTGRVRIGLHPGHLLLQAQILDEKPRRDPTPWKASSFEIFASTPGEGAIGQVFLLPQVGKQEATALVKSPDGPKPATDIDVRTDPIDGGYEILARIPLHNLALPKDATAMMLEFQVGAHHDGKLLHSTAFDSVHAYEDNRRYGYFVVPGVEVQDGAADAEAEAEDGE